MKSALFIFLLINISLCSTGPTAYAQKSISPYEMNGLRDGIWTGMGILGTGLGVYLIAEKEGISEARLAEIINDRENINGLDRWAAGNSNENSNMLSDIPFYASFAAPFALLFDDHMNDHTGQILVLYLEAIGTTGAMYSLTSSLVNRSRPYVYADKVEIGQRLSSNGQQSFYSGHVGAAAAATFLTAKVFNDFHPDASAKSLVWITAAAIPAAIGYFRIDAGRHFLTDILLGYGLGAATGILVPEMHKRKDAKFSLAPSTKVTFLGDSYSSLSLKLNF